MPPWRSAPGCVIVRVRLTPKSSVDAVGGITTTAEGAALAVRVRAVPSEGEANSALERVVAAWLGIPRSKVTLAAGGKSRVKSLAVAGEPAEIIKRLAALTGAAGS